MNKIQIIKNILLVLILILFINCSNDSLNNSNSTTKDTWSLISDFSGGDETTNMCSNGASMFVGTAKKGVYRSNDYGKTWILVNNGIVNLNDSRVYSDKGILYLSTYTYAKTSAYTGTSIVEFYKSINNGNIWIPIWSSLSGTDIGEQFDITFLNSKIFITCRGSQRDALNARLPCVNASMDNGNNWNTSLITTDTTVQISTSTSYTNPIVAVGSNYYRLGANGEVYKSTDGINFLYNSIMTDNQCDNITSFGTKLFMGGWGRGYVSIDSGINWTSFKILETFGIGNLYSDGVNIYAGQFNSIYISKNGGSSWTQLGSDISSDTTENNEVVQILKLDSYVFIRCWETTSLGYKIYRIAS